MKSNDVKKIAATIVTKNEKVGNVALEMAYKLCKVANKVKLSENNEQRK